MAEHPIIEVVVERTDTAKDQVVVFVDGVLTDAHVVLIDPGQGWTRAEWNSYRITFNSPHHLTPACKEHVCAVFDRNDDSEYIE